MTHTPQLIVIAGPTAVGKTSLAIKIAQYFRTEILSADSRQFFREMNIGTAKPSSNELNMVRHHFINNKSINEDYDAGKFALEAEKLLMGLFQKLDRVVLVGGSGLYIKALCDGLDEMPEIPMAIREELNLTWQEGGDNQLLTELAKRDPEYFQQVDQNNKQRVIRALEVIRATGSTYSSFRNAKKPDPKSYSVIKIGLEMERSKLYDRIEKRMDLMIEDGLFEEAERLFPFRQLNSLRTVGYKEIFDFMDGEYNKEEAVRLLKRNSRRYAKRQMTWFKRDPKFKWFQPLEEPLIIKFLEDNY